MLPGWARMTMCPNVLSCTQLSHSTAAAIRATPPGQYWREHPRFGVLGLGWGRGAVQLPALQPQHPARRSGGGGFALFTLQLWLWLEFVKGSG